MRVRDMLVVGVIFASWPMPAHAQFALTQIPGLLECSENSMAACMERHGEVFRKEHPDLVHKDSNGTTNIRLISGAWRKIESEWPFCWDALTLQGDDRYLTLGCIAEEDEWWKLVDRASDRIYDSNAYPYLSPDTRHIAFARNSEMNGHRLQVYELTSKDMTLVFNAMIDDLAWFPKDVCWADDKTVIYKSIARAWGNSKTVETTRAEYLKHANGKWGAVIGRPPGTGLCSDLLG